jgi:surface antigen
MDRADEARAQRVLEKGRTGETVTWKNPDTGNTVAVTPTRTYQARSGQHCREYQTEVIVGGKREAAYGTACRQPDGSWKIVK